MSRVFTVLLLMSLVQWTSPDDQQFFRGHTGENVTLTFRVPTGTTSVWLKRIDEKYDGRSFNETIFLIVTDPDQQIVSCHTGQNETLTFQVPTGTTSVWLKRLHNEKYISYCRDGNPTRPSDQEESFKGRVEEMDCNMMNSNFSVTVRNLTSNDNGTYEFHGMKSDGRRFNKTIFLIVTDPDQQIVSCHTGANETLTFQGQVEGMDCGNINGTISVTVRNLTSNDNGTYEFHGMKSDGRRFNKTIFLIVTDSVNTVNPFLYALGVGAVVCIAIGLFYGRQSMKTKSCPSVSDLPCVKRPHHDDDGDEENAPEKKTLQEYTGF